MSEPSPVDTVPDDVHSAHQDATSQHLDKKVLLVAGVVVLGSIMSILDITVVGVGIPTFMSSFGKTQAQVAWIATGYTLALATVIPITGWAADRFGTKRLYLAAIALFAIGSALCSTANSLELLIVFRVLQGFGGGMLMPLGMTMLTRAAGPDRLGRVMAILGVPMLLGPIFGPILGGWLIDIASWHWIFLINVPIGIITLVYAYFALEKDDASGTDTFDFVGVLFLSPGLALLLYGVSSFVEAKTADDAQHWTTVVVACAIGLILICLFIWWALRRKNIHPLVDLRLFRDRNVTVSVISLVFFCAAFFGASLLFPNYYQSIRMESPLRSGVLLAPQGIGAMLIMPLAGYFADKLGPRRVVVPGIALIVIGMGMFSTLDNRTNYWFLALALFIQGLGMGCSMMPLFSSAMATLSQALVARGSTLVNIVQQIAGSIGTALFSVLLTDGIHSHPSTPWVAFSHTFWVGTILVAVILVPAFFLPRTHAAEVHAPMH